jgi:hypothetical protein
MRPEQQRERDEQEMAVASTEVAERINPDRSHDDAADEVSLRGKAHTAPEHPWRPSLSPELARTGRCALAAAMYEGSPYRSNGRVSGCGSATGVA